MSVTEAQACPNRALPERFEPFTFEGQKDVSDFGLEPGARFPLALRVEEGWHPTLEESVDSIRELANSGDLKRIIQRHGGALLIRGLPIQTAEDYSKVAHAFDLGPAHEEVGRPPIRTVLAKNVKTANEGYARAPPLAFSLLTIKPLYACC